MTRRHYRFLFVNAPGGGTTIFMDNLREALSSRTDVEMDWVDIEGQPKEFLANIFPISKNWTLKTSYVAYSRIRKLEQSGKPFDAAFFNHLTGLSLLLNFRKRVPTILSADATPHTLDEYGEWYLDEIIKRPGFVKKITRRWARKSYTDIALLLPWANYIKRSLMNDYGIEEDKIKLLPPGVDLKKWDLPPRQTPLPGTKRKPAMRFLFVGGEFKRKGGDILLNVAGHEAFQDCEFHFVTRDFAGEPLDNVCIHSNIQANSEPLMELYRQADAFVVPTRADFLPNAISEALAMGLPVVSTGVGGIPDIVIDGENGLIVPENDEHALADALRLLTEDPALLIRMSRNARKFAEEHLDLENNSDRILEYMKLVADRA